MASGARKFKFISPGVFINEIDRSQLPNLPTAIGPVVIGRSRQGPGLRPVQVSSFEEYVRVFGTPDPGVEGSDNWRQSNFDAPTYAPYAAQAWLASGQAPVTMVRLLGAQHNNYGTGGEAGWALTGAPNSSSIENAGAFGLFLINSSSTNLDQCGGLGAVFYITEGNSIFLSGSQLALDATSGVVPASGSGVLVSSQASSAEFKAVIVDSNDTVLKNITFNFNRNSERYIRKVFNTNPSETNSTIVASADREVYWLGETYDQFLGTKVDPAASSAGTVLGGIVGLYTASSTYGALDWDLHQASFQASQTPWFRAQDMGASSDYMLSSMQKLFKFTDRGYGEWASQNIKVSIENLRASEYPQINPYGTFSVVLRHVQDTDNAPRFLERFDMCDLNPNSEHYIARKIGDKYLSWDDSARR